MTLKRRDRPFSLHAWIQLLAAAATGATLLGFAGTLEWRLSFLEYPRPQYCLMLLVALLAAWIRRRPWRTKLWSLGWFIPLGLNLILLTPLWASSPPSVPQPASSLRVLHATLDHQNPDVGAAIRYLKQQKADIVSLLEVTRQSLPQFQKELADYQMVAAELRPGSSSSAWFLAKQPTQPIVFRSSEVIHLPEGAQRPLLKAIVSVAGRDLVLLCFHTIRPRSPGTVAFQRVELAAMAAWSQQQLQTDPDRDLIVIGDFNSTPWATPFRQALATSGLVNSQVGFGWQTTWHAALPNLLRIPIDHCLHSPGLRTIHRTIGPNLDSDHLPLLVELQRTR